MSCSGEFWIGLAQIKNNHRYWVNGTRYTGSKVSGSGQNCVNAKVTDEVVQWKLSNCDALKKYFCEDVAPPGKKEYLNIEKSHRYVPL